jgi:hypothetical protein
MAASMPTMPLPALPIARPSSRPARCSATARRLSLFPCQSRLAAKARPHMLAATLAWFTPVSPGRKSYRSCKLKILDPTEIGALAVAAHSNQPDGNQTNRGTVFTRCWSGDSAPVVGPDMTIALQIQREPDQAAVIDEPLIYGLAVTLAMPGELRIYEQARARIAPPIRP